MEKEKSAITLELIQYGDQVNGGEPATWWGGQFQRKIRKLKVIL